MKVYSEAIESKLSALRESQAARSRGFEADHEHRRLFGNFERMMLRRADCYFWTRDIASTVLESSKSLPEDTVISLANYKDLDWHWFWFEQPLKLEPLMPFSGVLWGAVTKGIDGGTDRKISIHLYGREYGQLQIQDSLYLPDMYTLARAFEQDAIPDQREARELGYQNFYSPKSHMQTVLRFFVASLLWLEQEIVVVGTHSPDRHAKKRIQAASAEQSTEIKVIELRRKRYEQSGQSDGSRHVEWSCQWIVRGHWRQQYYPSNGERRPKWILPYVKGPEDQPLKTPQMEVFAVRR